MNLHNIYEAGKYVKTIDDSELDEYLACHGLTRHDFESLGVNADNHKEHIASTEDFSILIETL